MGLPKTSAPHCTARARPALPASRAAVTLKAATTVNARSQLRSVLQRDLRCIYV